MTLRDLVTRELERVVKVHVADGISIKRARIERPFRYRFAFEDLGTYVDCAIDAEGVLTTTTTTAVTNTEQQPEATVRLAATKLSHLFIIARQQGMFDAETLAAIGELGFTFEGSLDLHRTVLELVGGAPSHFQAALDTIDHHVTSTSVDHLLHTTLETTEEAARRAVCESRPLLVRGFPFSWNGMTRESFLKSYGTHEAWVEGQLIALEVFADHERTTPREAYSPVNPTDAVYATNLVAPERVARMFTTPLFEDRCGPSRLFGGRSVLEDKTAWARVTRPHRHAHDVLAWQVFGKKKWIVVPPAHRMPLELRPLGFDTQFCGVLDPDLIDDPAFQKAATTIVMEPGELLVLPGGWFHVTYVTREPALGFSAFARDEVLRFSP